MITTVKELIAHLKTCPPNYTVEVVNWQFDDNRGDEQRALNLNATLIDDKKKQIIFD